MPQYVHVMKGLTKAYPGGRKVLDGIWLSFFPGAKIGVLGPNGAGKSTLLRIMAGIEKDFDGESWTADGFTVGHLPQEPELDNEKDVLGNVMEAMAETKALLDSFNQISERFAEPLSDDEMSTLIAQQGEIQEKIDAVNGWDLERSLEIAMDALRLPPSDSAVGHLSGGEKRRVALCRLLLSKPDLLLLDEPTNHLDAESVAWLEQHLARYEGTVVAITHDRYFLENVAGWILELDRGRGIPYEGNYSGWLQQKRDRLAQEGRAEDAVQKTLARELEWVRASPQARQAKGKARLAAYEELLERSRQRSEGPTRGDIVIAAGPRLGEKVIVADGLEMSFGNRLLFESLDFVLPQGGIVGIIGPNGAGKSTLFRILLGEIEPTAGEVNRGDSVVTGYVDQSRESLVPDKTVWEEISGGADLIELGRNQVNSRAWVSSFGFRGTDQQMKVGQLSGGERNRVHLAKMLKSGANVLFLDEPSNDLDVDTLRSLEDALESFAGCVLVISHDRWFLNRLATHILAFEGDSHVEWFEGNYEAYEQDRKRRLGAAADMPHRIRYKPLTRQ